MKSRFDNNDIFKLFMGLKSAENKYPSDLISLRRDMYIKRAAAMVVLMKSGGTDTDSASGGSSAFSSLAGFTPSIGNTKHRQQQGQ